MLIEYQHAKSMLDTGGSGETEPEQWSCGQENQNNELKEGKMLHRVEGNDRAVFGHAIHC